MRKELSNGTHGTCPSKSALPIVSVKSNLVKHLCRKNTNAWIILGETASGKSTQIPQIIFDCHLHNNLIIGCTQPRRVAAISIASFVSHERGCNLGQLVGYSVRFENAVSSLTRLKYMTDGILLREALLDPSLKNYGWIILDEVHERTVHTDVLFGVVKRAQLKRNSSDRPLKVILMSATMDVDKFSTYFEKAPVIYVEGRCNPVDIYYAPENYEDYAFHCMVTVCQLNRERPIRDGFLVFLTGQEEIDSFSHSLRGIAKSASPEELPNKFQVSPLYAHLPLELQLQAVREAPPGYRKIVVATNIAETSVTIPGINVVIDSGRIKMKQFVASSQLDILKVNFISQAQAVQRSGRAGRQQAGACYRMFTEQKFTTLQAVQKPEILRCSLLGVCLELLAIGIKNIQKFDFMDKPSEDNIQAAIDQLVWIGALPKSSLNELSEDGKIMARFPLDPPLSKVLISAQNLGCLKEAIIVVSMLSVENIFHSPLNSEEELKQAVFRSEFGDHVTLLNVFTAFVNNGSKRSWCLERRLDFRNLIQAEKIVNQLNEIASSLEWKLETHGEDTEPLRSSLAAGLFFKSAMLQQDGTYKTVFANRIVHVHPSSSLFAWRSSGKSQPTSVVYTELIQSTKSYMKSISVVNYEDLLQFVPSELRWRFENFPSLQPSITSETNGFHHHPHKKAQGC